MKTDKRRIYVMVAALTLGLGDGSEHSANAADFVRGALAARSDSTVIEQHSEEDAAEELLQLFESEENLTNSLGAVMVWIPAGFRVAATEVTQAQYLDVMGVNPSQFKGPRLPVHTVTPSQAKAFCQKLTDAEREQGVLPGGFSYQLSTESEFMGFLEGTLPYTACISLVGDRAAPIDVGSLPPNDLGLYDVYGNVWEWCANNVAKGSSYQSHEDHLRYPFRFVGTPDTVVTDIGFRIVLKGPVRAQ